MAPVQKENGRGARGSAYSEKEARTEAETWKKHSGNPNMNVEVKPTGEKAKKDGTQRWKWTVTER